MFVGTPHAWQIARCTRYCPGVMSHVRGVEGCVVRGLIESAQVDSGRLWTLNHWSARETQKCADEQVDVGVPDGFCSCAMKSLLHLLTAKRKQLTGQDLVPPSGTGAGSERRRQVPAALDLFVLSAERERQPSHLASRSFCRTRPRSAPREVLRHGTVAPARR